MDSAASSGSFSTSSAPPRSHASAPRRAAGPLGAGLPTLVQHEAVDLPVPEQQGIFTNACLLSILSLVTYETLELAAVYNGRATLADRVADSLRVAIIEGRFADGEELNQVELARAFDTSRPPVREALSKLEAEGLVDLKAHRLAVVIGLSVARVQEVFGLRRLLEGELLEQAAPQLDGRALERLDSLCDEMDRMDEAGAWLAANAQFHRGLYEPAGATITLGFAEQIAGRVERYLRQATGHLRVLREVGSKEHRQILAELRSGDLAAARRALEGHIDHTRQNVLTQLESRSS